MITDIFRSLLKSPGMYVPNENFDSIVSFMIGFDSARDGGPLVGFREWLIVRVGSGDTLHWPALILRLIFPEAASPRAELFQQENQVIAIRAMTTIYEEFWQERNAHDGLCNIFLNYQKWLEALEYESD
jgi:hypothetical protein